MSRIKYNGNREDYLDFLVGRLLRFANETSAKNYDEALDFIMSHHSIAEYESYITILEEELLCGCEIPSPE